MQNKHWLLPEGIDELLPDQAKVLEQLRRRLLDLYASWGYELIVPPFIEYLDSLLTGTGKDLDLQTFKLTDQMSGRQLGVRADITPQASRIDAHQLRRDVPTRLCYIGSVLRTLSDGFAGSRSPLQIGAELYGHDGVESEVEILLLMMATLDMVGIKDVYLDLGHVGIYRGLARQAKLNGSQEAALFEALQRKAIPEIKDLVSTFDVSSTVKSMLLSLAELNGGIEVIELARERLADANSDVIDAIESVAELADKFSQRLAGVPIHFDLAELRAYHYQTGAVFAAFVPGLGEEIARGGRYDHIGEIFGRARPATGFSADLKTLMRMAEPAVVDPVNVVFAPAVEDAALDAKIADLRAQGRVVIQGLPDQTGDAKDMGCTHSLQKTGDEWGLVTI